MKKIEQFIEIIPIFKGLTKRQRQRLAPLFVKRSYDPDQPIVSQGIVGVGLYIISSGQAEAIRQNPEGEEFSVSTFGPTDFFGELALLSEGKRTATVFARQPTTCFVLSRSDFLDLLNGDATMATAVAQTIASRFRREIERLNSA